MNPGPHGPPGPQGWSIDGAFGSQQQAEAIVRIVEAGPQVRRRYQFFAWTQGQMQTLLPHEILVCGAYQRQRRDLVLEAFNNVVLQPEVLQVLTDVQGPLMRTLLAAWIDGRAAPLRLQASRLSDAGVDGAATLLRANGIESLMAHGVARPQRPAEIETFFVFASVAGTRTEPALSYLELLLPHLHTIWQRVMATERDMAPPLPAAVRAARTGGVTDRERQILLWVREGKSNQQIAEVLGISPLTVKNHIQKILRKLGASNRAHAVAEAMAAGLLGDTGSGAR